MLLLFSPLLVHFDVAVDLLDEHGAPHYADGAAHDRERRAKQTPGKNQPRSIHRSIGPFIDPSIDPFIDREEGGGGRRQKKKKKRAGTKINKIREKAMRYD